MKIDRNRQIPKVIIYVALYAIMFGVDVWLLTNGRERSERDTWIIYISVIGSVFVGSCKLALRTSKRRKQMAFDLAN